MSSKFLKPIFIVSILFCVFATVAIAETVVVMPDSVVLKPGHGIHFKAQIFTDNGDIVRIPLENYRWSVVPQELGRISEDGFFIAGKKAGKGKVIAAISRNGKRHIGEADVWVGILPKPPIEVKVVPHNVIVPPETRKQFKVVAQTASGRKIQIDRVRWSVEPPKLGKIDAKGIFVAGKRIMGGAVIAKLNIDGQTYTAKAHVIVGPRPTSMISGVITDEATQTPLSKAFVWAHRIGHFRWSKKAMTNENGEYSLKRLLPGKYVIFAGARTYIAEWYDNVRQYEQATPLEVAENDTLPGIDLTLSKGAAIAGKVTLQASDSLLKGVHIVVHNQLTPKRKHHTLSDENGEYTVEGLVSGKYVVMAEKEGYHPEWYNDKTKPREADLVEVTEPDITPDINFTLTTAMAITGKVVCDGDNTPIAGARVYAKHFENGRITNLIIHQSKTNRDGEYVIQVAKAGNYLVGADAHGYVGEMYQDAYKLTDVTPVKVEPDKHTPGIDFDLLKKGSLSGQVVEEGTQTPIEGAIVEAYIEVYRIAPGRWPVFRARTDSNGNYTIDNMIAGKYRVKATARNYLPEFYQDATSPSEATVVEVKNATDLPAIDFTLTSGGCISGVVATNTDSMPIPKALVSVKRIATDENGKPVPGNLIRTALTGRDGAYKIKGLPSGKYIVWTKARGYKALFYKNAENIVDATKVPVRAAEETGNIDFYLPQLNKPQGTISGRVAAEVTDSTATDPTEPLEGAWVLAIPVSPRKQKTLPAWTVTNELGEYCFDKLRPGKYLVAAWAAGYIGEYFDDARHWKKAKPVPVEADKSTENINFVLAPASQGAYAIAGQVTDMAGNPLTQAMVYAKDNDGVKNFALTDGDGHYVIDNLNPGEYVIEVNYIEHEDGYYGGTSEESAQPVVVGDGKQASNMNIELAAGATAVETDLNSIQLPDRFSLEQNYPNPFNPSTRIQYQLPMDAKVTLKIFNVLGQNVRTLIDKNQPAGNLSVHWDGRDSIGNIVPSGIYFYQLTATAKNGTTFQKVMKMSMIK